MSSAQFQWSREGITSEQDESKAFRNRLHQLAEAHTATTASTIVTKENVQQAKRLMTATTPGPFWILLDLGGTILLGLGGKLLLGKDLAFLGFCLVCLGAIAALVAKLSCYMAPYSAEWREFVRVRGWWM